ncbi:adenosylcobinamide-GDP ribazoletransferase [Candidatus Atelocyanobacterium thalassae]|uniref:Adenosylcobinamide-GDP ribazoletransferase n=1 Tax=Atelocyanobacterium thalassa (isolate ALOHA) TaxID=1453429 RepID=D3ER07_ATETH|nr:adenosylcobinamide-GDP ribazoletransferase [Candidatus Atelocyanobacterium thalassa]ADB95907.1 cobalamin-5'-phosphate synthase [Candidatus Atelocyanobacterium thalassa isolate ALOHA]MCH2543615.1 adenosylcobinamide-GDP ribazoletransferase [Candidatus Atelocyanobacterium sp. ALOHA_A2.5_9]
MLKSLLGSITFYTIIPLPNNWEKSFQSIAAWSPVVGLLIGTILGLVDYLLIFIGFPILIRSTLIVFLGILITGGLHLDGVIDSADGITLSDPQKKLMAMQDSSVGAFGVIAGIMVILLKVVALSAIDSYRLWILMITYAWGRWAQLFSITFYTYLKKAGKGLFHKQYINYPNDLLFGTINLLIINILWMIFTSHQEILGIIIMITGIIISVGISYFFNKQFEGHTGDTYGAVVEWTESLILCVLVLYFSG